LINSSPLNVTTFTVVGTK